MNNHWGEPDEVDFPDWMLPDNHPMKMMKGGLKQSSGSVEDAVREAMKKPAIDLNNVSWDEWKPNKDIT